MYSLLRGWRCCSCCNRRLNWATAWGAGCFCAVICTFSRCRYAASKKCPFCASSFCASCRWRSACAHCFSEAYNAANSVCTSKLWRVFSGAFCSHANAWRLRSSDDFCAASPSPSSSWLARNMAALSDAMAFWSSSPSWCTFSKCDKAKGDFGLRPISTAAAQKYRRADGVSLNKAFNFGVTRSNSLARIRLSTSNSRQEVASLSVGVCSKKRASTEGWFCTSTSIITCVLVSISASFAATRCKAWMAKRSSPPLPTLAKISAMAASVRWLFATAARWMAVRPCSLSRG